MVVDGSLVARDDPSRTHARAPLVHFLSRAGRGDGSEGFDGPLALELKKLGSDQLQPFEARVHGYAERLCHLDHRLRHLDVGA